jgi:HlyD family secretion protein
VKKILIIFIILIIAVGAFYFYQRSTPKVVNFTRVEQADYFEKILTSGTVLLEGLTEVKTEVSGKIVDVYVDEGDIFKKGQTLLRFDDTDVNLDLKQAEASYTLAQSRYDEIINTTCPTSQEQYRQAILIEEDLQGKAEKYQILYDQKAISLDKLEEVKHQLELQQSNTMIQKNFMESCAEGGAKRETALAEMKAAQARIDLLKNNLKKHTILLPLDGIILQKYKSPGEYAMIGEGLFTIAKQDSKYVEIELDERNLPRISLNQTVSISTEFAPENKIQGYIDYIAYSVDPNKGTVKINVKLIEDEDFLIEYLTVRCEIISKEYPNSLVIPQMFVFQENDDYFVFYYRDGLAQKKMIKIDNPSAQEIRIIEGILANEIILEPEGLKTGMKVILAE